VAEINDKFLLDRLKYKFTTDNPDRNIGNIKHYSPLECDAVQVLAAGYSSETSMNPYQTARHHIPEDVFHSHCCENLKSSTNITLYSFYV
jgi:hypothetical protein